MNVDQAALQFNPASLNALNLTLAIVMFGIAIDMKVDDFRALFKQPWPIAVGLFSQFFLLPAITFALCYVLRPQASLALGLMLVAACPGGNISNFITHLAGGNAALSVTMSAFATVLAAIMTPFNLAFYGGLMPETAAILTEVELSPLDMAGVIFTIMGIPLALGLTIAEKKPEWADKMRGPLKKLSIVIFLGFIVGALVANREAFSQYWKAIAGLVLVHNALAFATGFSFATICRLSDYNRRAVTIETGIQNSGLGLILIFGFFNGLGGMAIIAAWWGGWHVISGLTLATFLSRRKLETA